MIFEEASTRTRVSFEVAMTKLGGMLCTSSPERSIWARRENIADTARCCRGWWTRWRSAPSNMTPSPTSRSTPRFPVINGLTDYNHPTQAVCDVFTMTEHTDKPFSELTVVFVGDATNVCTSTAQIVTMLGGTFIHARPEQYGIKASGRPSSTDREERRTLRRPVLRDRGRRGRGRQCADYIYTDLWWWFGQEAEIPDRVKAFKPRYQVNAATHGPGTRARQVHALPSRIARRRGDR